MIKRLRVIDGWEKVKHNQADTSKYSNLMIAYNNEYFLIYFETNRVQWIKEQQRGSQKALWKELHKIPKLHYNEMKSLLTMIEKPQTAVLHTQSDSEILMMVANAIMRNSKAPRISAMSRGIILEPINNKIDTGARNPNE